MDDLRKKSPRAPSIPLGDAIDRVYKIYDKERRHAAPADIIAQDMGYKSANNGRALSAIASLRYYGLLDRASEGKLAVTKDVEDYRFSPSEALKREIAVRWLKSPPTFSELLDKFSDGLPSDGVLRFELIQRGFNPSSAESVLDTFKKSVEFSQYFHNRATADPEERDSQVSEISTSAAEGDSVQSSAHRSAHADAADVDRIPIRLSGGRKAWLEIPASFFEADKARIKAQIDLLLTEEQESE